VQQQVPAEYGYYMTEYRNLNGNIYYKAIWYGKKGWSEWNPRVAGLGEVIRYKPTRYNYYTECIAANEEPKNE